MPRPMWISGEVTSIPSFTRSGRPRESFRSSSPSGRTFTAFRVSRSTAGPGIAPDHRGVTEPARVRTLFADMSRRSLLVLLCVLALALAGCSSGSDSSEGGGGTNGTGGGTTAGAAEGEGGETSGEGDGEASGGQDGGTGDGAATGEAEAAAVLLTVAETSLGQILVDGRGHTVYLFTPDKVGKKSVCTGPCTEVWIPASAGRRAGGRGRCRRVAHRDDQPS